MKIASDIKISASPETIWKTLIDFDNYSKWNHLNLGVHGQPLPDAKLNMDIQFRGGNKQKVIAMVTGFISPKYLSWTWQSKLGAWWFQIEQVLRVKEDAMGDVQFFQELYVTGIKLRFIRRNLERFAQYSIEHMNEDLKEFLEQE